MSTPHVARDATTDAAWAQVLEELEAGLDVLETALDDGAPVEPASWTPPTGLGPVPPNLRERAADLLSRLQDLSDELRDARTAALGDVQRTRLRRDAAAAYHAAG